MYTYVHMVRRLAGCKLHSVTIPKELAGTWVTLRGSGRVTGGVHGWALGGVRTQCRCIYTEQKIYLCACMWRYSSPAAQGYLAIDVYRCVYIYVTSNQAQGCVAQAQEAKSFQKTQL